MRLPATRRFRDALMRSIFKACLKGNIAITALLGMGQQAIAQVIPTDISQSEVTVNDVGNDADGITADFTITGGDTSGDGANLFHEFEQFSIGANQSASFVTAPDIQNVLGLITGEASSIDGLLQVLGSQADLYLVNPAGILFGPNVQLNLPGSLTATTATGIEFGDQWLDVLTLQPAERSTDYGAFYSALVGAPSAFDFASGVTTGSSVIATLGNLTLSEGQTLSLIGNTVLNTGTISVPGGNVTLVAAEDGQLVRLGQGERLLSLEVSGNEIPTTFESQTLSELLTGSGLDYADKLIANADGTVSLVSSTGVSADVGIPENPGTVVVSGEISVESDRDDKGEGGEINAFGEQVALFNAQLSASGSQGGGILRIGGDAKGSDLAPTARRTYIDGDSLLSADAIAAGDGGQIYIWSDEATHFYGALSAVGGDLSGDGGFAEISGKLNLVYDGSVDLSASQGSTGTLLFDPLRILIKAGSGTNTTGDDAVLPEILDTSDNLFPFEIYESTLEALSSGTSIILESATDIMIESLEGGELTLMDGNNIRFTADANNNGTGSFFMVQSDTIRTAGGNVRIMAGNDGTESVIGNIDTSTDTGQSGNISISDKDQLFVGNLNAGNGNITLTSNGIDLLGGADSIVANVVTLRPGDNSTDIYIGTTQNNADALDLSVADIQALGSGIGRIEIGRGTNDGRVKILEAAADGRDGAFTSPTEIVSENITLVGPDRENIWRLNAPIGDEGTSTLDGYSNLFFRTVSHLEGGALNDTIVFADESTFISGTIDGKDGDLLLIGDEINLLDMTRGTGNLFIRAASDSQAILLGGTGDASGSGDTLDLVEEDLFNIIDSFESITIGSRDGGSISLLNEQSYRLPLTLLSDRTIDTLGGRLSTMNRSALTLDADTIMANVLATDGGDISLKSVGSVTVADLDARNPSFNESLPVSSTNQSGGTITVDTDRYFQVSAAEIEASGTVTTNGGSAVTIRHGGNGEVPFLVGASSFNGVSAQINNGVDDIVEGTFVGSYVQGAIEIMTAALQPPEQLPEQPLEVLAPIDVDRSALRQPILEERGDRAVNALFSDQESETSQEIFSRIEAAAGAQFEQFLSLTARKQSTKIATLIQVQDTLAEAELNLSIDPALLYVYFVPSAESSESVAVRRDNQPNAFQLNGRADDQLEVMLIPPRGRPIRKRLWGVTRAQVEAQSTELRYQATNQFSRKSDYLPPAQQLYDWIIRPLSEDLATLGTDNIAFIMDDGLRTIPIAALYDGEQFLVERYSLALMPTFSLTDLSSMTLSSMTGRERYLADSSDVQADYRQTERQSLPQVLAMGASRFSAQPPLPAVEAELTMVADELWQGEAFLNESFTLANLKQQLEQERYGLLHLATHAVFNSGDWDNSYIQLWDEKVSLKALGELDLRQSNIDLIILSACNTAMGDRNSEYGFAGFAVNAGSASALASLWPVSDEGTLGFMSQFYEQLSQQSTKSESLRQAQIRLLNGEVRINNGQLTDMDGSTLASVPELAESGNWDFSHPFYWSAFTMIGNPW